MGDKAIRVVLVGTGGHASVVWDAIQASNAAGNTNIHLVAWVEHANYNGPNTIDDIPVWRENDNLQQQCIEFEITHIAYGLGCVNAKPVRLTHVKGLSEKLNLTPLTVVHPTAIVASSAKLGAGAVVAAGAIVQPYATIGDFCILNTGSIVEHHSNIGDNTHIAPGAVVCGNVTVSAHSLVGANATLRQGVAVARETTIGAGAVVIANIDEPGQTWVGNPARRR